MQDLVPNLKKVRKGLGFIYFSLVAVVLGLMSAGIFTVVAVVNESLSSIFLSIGTLFFGLWVANMLLVVGKILCLDTPVGKNTMMASLMIDSILLFMGGDRISIVGALLTCLSFGLFLFFLYQLSVYQNSERTRSMLAGTVTSGGITFAAMILIIPVFLINPDTLVISSLITLSLVVVTLIGYLRVLAQTRRTLSDSIIRALSNDFIPTEFQTVATEAQTLPSED